MTGLSNSVPRPKQMTLCNLFLEFGKTQGGWIATSTVLAFVLRSSLQSPNTIDLLLAFLVVSSWPLMEWIFHRFLMHEWTFLPFHFTHDRHHVTPTAATGLPDAWIVAMYFANTIAFWWFGLAYLSTLNAAILVMLVIYEFVHFSCHCNYKPITSWGWAVRVNHLQHHKLDETKGYSMLFPIAHGKKQLK